MTPPNSNRCSCGWRATRPAARRPIRSRYFPVRAASARLGNSEAAEYPLKTLPRPKGRSTKVVITEYDLPRRNALAHDVIVDRDGKVWYSDFGAQVVGVM